MLNLKKTAVAVLALGSSAVFAGTMGPVCTPGNVTVPCESTAWDFGGYALYIQPTSDFEDSFFLDGDHDNRNWNWGFKLEASYHFYTGNDLNINWYHFNPGSDDHHHNSGSTFDVDGFFPTRLTIEPKWDAVNIEFGQHVDWSERAKARFHAGAQWAHLEHEFHLNTPLTGFNLNSKVEYNGFGPRGGLDLSYMLGYGFSIYGNAAATALVGHNEFQVRTSLPDVGLNVSKTSMVPEIEGKLGIKYDYLLAQGDLAVDAGYMWNDYIHAQQTFLVKSDLGFNGVYFGLKWVGNV